MLRLILLLPFLIVLIAFALSNQESVQLSLWPTDWSIEAPVSLAVLCAAGLFFFLGALFVWFGSVGHRRRARRAERHARMLTERLGAHEAAASVVPPAVRSSPAPVGTALMVPK